MGVSFEVGGLVGGGEGRRGRTYVWRRPLFLRLERSAV